MILHFDNNFHPDQNCFYKCKHKSVDIQNKKSKKSKRQLKIIMKMTENVKQRRLRHYVDAPRRFLRRARDFYVDSLINFDSKVGAITCPAANTPKNLRSYKRKEADKEEIMSRSICSSMELDRVGCFRERGSSGYGGVIDRSYSVALGKIGTIDEDEQCEFQENVTHHMFLRTRSHAVTTNYDFH